ncbi:hypothetical protein CPB86DRAFT_787124 [Serendipita vermifera]|nr:hypothetical protein CPB86DRAFT_787124 [Serendipita vermifera]
MTQLNNTQQVSGPASNLRLTLSADAGNSSLLATVHGPAEPGSDGTPPKRAPVDLCCVIDVSGSMDDDAAVPSEQDKPLEVTGLSVMDVTKHAMKTIISSMGEEDRLALVSFSSSSKVVANLTETTEAGKKRLLKAVDGLQPDAATNLWDGLKTGMNLFNESTENTEHRVQAVFILTDGMPNVEPPRGHIPMFKHYLESNPQTRFNVSTFGFGYSLDSRLLSEFANVGGGSYGFIPDAGMVGTVFVHALANLFATYATRAVLNVEVPSGVTVKPVRGSYTTTPASWGSRIEIGDIQYGQTRDFVLEFEGGSPNASQEVNVSLVVQPWHVNNAETLTQTICPVVAALPEPENFLVNKYRLDLVTYIYRLCALYHGKNIETSDAVKYFTDTAAEIQSRLPTNQDALGLANDMAGELTLAVKAQANWKKWGLHYFPSLARSHQRQQCGNFKDQGLQTYGQNSTLFIKSRDAVDSAFDSLPPPKPSKKVYTKAATSTSRGVNYQQLYSMAQYNSRAGPCFAGDSMVMLADGSQTRVDAVKRGTLVQTPQGPRSVAAVINTLIPTGKLALCRIGELTITPWHPIHHNGAWKFPSDVVMPQIENVDSIYSFLLQPSQDEAAHAMTIGGMTCVTLGHGIVREDSQDVRGHAFFGSYEKVLAAVASLPGFYEEDGIVQCSGVIRGEDGLICGFTSPLEKQTNIIQVASQAILKTVA